MADHDTHDHTGVTGVPSATAPNPTTIELGHASDTTLSRASAGVVAVEGTNLVKAGAATGSGITMATARLLGRTTASSGAIEEITVGNGLALASTALTVSATITVQSLGADQTTNNTSTWTDVTGMTGISLVAGTYLGMIDVEHQCTTNYGPVFRITDGTNTYGQMGYIGNYIATVSTHQAFFCQPFALGSTTSVKLQYFTDTVMVIKRYPTRGADSGIVATRAMFWRIV
jgi:hypothetical protein